MGSRSAIICAVIGIIGATIGSSISAAVASDIIDEWANVKTPAAPEIKAVTVDPKTTALIMGDLMNQSCAKRAALRGRASRDEEAPWRSACGEGRGHLQHN